MSVSLSAAARDVLGSGTFCHVAAFRGEALHVTPVVFVFDGGRIWLTTSRSSVKARAWRDDPRTAGLVVHGNRAVTFRGTVRAFDLLDPGTWAASAVQSPAITRAAARFSLKNARFFAGYARDAHRVPLSWTPPARVFASVDLQDAALLDVATGEVVERWGRWTGGAHSSATFRQDADAAPSTALADVPPEVAEAVGTRGDGALATLGDAATVLPVRWRAAGADFEIRVSAAHLALTGAPASPGASLVGQKPSAWRAREMRGFLAEGRAAVHLPERTRTGRAELERALARDGAALARLRPDRLVWWSGWAAGTVKRVTEAGSTR